MARPYTAPHGKCPPPGELAVDAFFEAGLTDSLAEVSG